MKLLVPILLAIGLSGCAPKYMMRGSERTVMFKGHADVDCDGRAENIEVFGYRGLMNCSTAITIREHNLTPITRQVNGYPVGDITIGGESGHEVSFYIDKDGDMEPDGRYTFPSCK